VTEETFVKFKFIEEFEFIETCKFIEAAGDVEVKEAVLDSLVKDAVETVGSKTLLRQSGQRR
jgi:hypothetical protein